jgi:hypothetical protein
MVKYLSDIIFFLIVVYSYCKLINNNNNNNNKNKNKNNNNNNNNNNNKIMK